MSQLAASVDRVVTLAVTKRQELDRPQLDDKQLMARAARAAEYFATVGERGFFQEPEPIQPVATPSPHGRFTSLTWPSTYRVYARDLERRYLYHQENAYNSVRLFRPGRPRPIAVLVHGYMGGALAIEQRIWPISWLDTLGFDAALFTLPFHGERSPSDSATPLYPQSDIRLNVEFFRQSVTDLCCLVHWLRGEGHPGVGLMGMSLGGYVSALTATVDATLQFLVPIIPLACLADFAREQGRVPRGARQAMDYQKTLKAAYRLVSPLARAPRIGPERVLVVAGRADRVTPPHHARSLAHHFRAPLESWNGGHLLQFGRAKSLQRVGTFLRRVSAAAAP